MRITRVWPVWKEMPRVGYKMEGDHLTERQQFSPVQYYYFFSLCYHRNMSCAICRSLLEQVLASAGSGQGLVWKNVSPEIERKRNGESTVCYPDVRKCLNNTHTFTLPGTHIWTCNLWLPLCLNRNMGLHYWKCSALTQEKWTNFHGNSHNETHLNDLCNM